MNTKYTLETCFSPALFPYRITHENYVVVVVDVLRATTSINAAFDNGVSSIIPVADVETAREFKAKGYLVASEREGKTLDFADFGNSAFNFMVPEVRGKTIVYSTTNGTQAIDMAVSNGADAVIGSFNNLKPLVNWLESQQKNVLILCSGFKNKFCIEDAFFAGALADELLQTDSFSSNCDSVTVSLDMWNSGKQDMLGYIEKAAHRDRLRQRQQDDVLEYSFTLNNVTAVPVYQPDNRRLVNARVNK